MFEKQKADENERAAKRMMEKPHGRRYDAITDYHQRIQMGDEIHGYDVEAVSTFNTSFYTWIALHTHAVALPWSTDPLDMPQLVHVLDAVHAQTSPWAQL